MMQTKDIYNLCLFLGIIFVLIVIYLVINKKPGLFKEGMTNSSGGKIAAPPNGVAGNAANYAATLKSNVIKSQDEFLISKYRSDYENVILNLDDFINNQMLSVALSIDPTKPQDSISQLAQMQQAKIALNTVMKYVDTQ